MPLRERFIELFPSKSSFLIFIAYIGLFVNQGLLVTASQQENNSYGYDVSVAVLISELLKFAASLILYCLEQPLLSILGETKKNVKVLWLYFLPSALYCFYNNLSYLNLKTFDPTTYFILLQLRVVATGVIFQIVFKKTLSKKQWLSLVVLTAACMVKQIKFGDKDEVPDSHNKQLGVTFSLSTLLILAQVFCSCFAGVYNEYLLKHQGVDVNIYLQNAFMYLDSIICNVLFILVTADIKVLLTPSTLMQFLNFKVVLVIVNNAALGIVTSFFLKSLNSILKNFASSLELVFTAILSWLFFSIPIHLNTALSILLIIIASAIYSQSPVRNQGPTKNINYEKVSTSV